MQSIKATIAKHKMFTPGDGIIVGLSGGADSVALLRVLLALSEELELGEIIPVHVNHNLRGEESVGDEKFASELCAGLNLPLKIYQADVKTFAAEKKLGIEEAGRILRYSFMEEARVNFNAQKIAVGHHQDDNAETVLMNLCRGSGLRGLCGIPPVNGNIVRPLIETPRLEIEKYLRDAKAPYVTDSSNSSQEYARNRIRHEIIPMLQAHANSNVAVTIARNAAWLKADEDFLEATAKKILDDLDKGFLSLDSTGLVELPEAISRRVIRLAIAQAKGAGAGLHSGGSILAGHRHLADISSAHVMAVLSLAKGHSGREVHIPGLVVKKEYSKLNFAAAKKASPSAESAAKGCGFCHLLKPDSSIYIPEIGKTLTLTSVPPDFAHPPDSKMPILYCTKAFKYDMVDMNNSYIRTRRPGDSIVLGNATHRFTKKLQDYFTDAKIPASLRDSVPLLASGSDILWIIDIDRVSEKYKPGTNPGELIWVTVWE
ncbi:MAG: tRNA lysidine(34) synthetase TilS [Defluviitaleaceae bacterium]|nr:tRNA lysidine(34) synthetase TilS [Defluviitaleaceae bacterium]